MAVGKRSSKRPLQEVLGQGANVNAANPLEVHDPKVGSLISYEGTTTADGAGDGSTLIDSALNTKPNFEGNLVIITSGAYAGQGRDLIGVTTGGTVTPASAFDGQILRGTTFVIVALRLTPAEVAALETKVERVDFYNRVFYDSVRGVAGIGYPIGTPQVPSNTIADAITILAARNLKALDVHGAVTLAVDLSHKDLFGNYHESVADIVTLGAGNDVSNTHFEGLIITGAQGGATFATYKECLLLNMTGFRGLAENCPVYGSLALATGGAVDYSDFDRCSSVHGVITITLGAPTRFSLKQFYGEATLTGQTGGVAKVRGLDGKLTIASMIGGSLDIYSDAGEIIINNTCTAGTINIYGNARVTDNSAAGCIVSDYSKETQLNDIEGKVDGIALGSYTEDSVSGATVNAWADALDVDTRGMKSMSAVVINTDVANSLDWRIRARPSNYSAGADEEIPECPGEETLAFGEKGLMELMKAYSRIKIQVKSTLADTPADYTIDYLINR